HLVLGDALAQPLQPTPQCHDGDAPTIRETEGPFFKPSSPQRANLVDPASKARLVELNGQVLSRSCRPVAQALIDLWHADERGEYDNAGFRYPGHVFTGVARRAPRPPPHGPRAVPPARPPPSPRQGAGAPSTPATPRALFAGRADEPARWPLSPRALDANGRGRGRPLRAVRFRARHALESFF